MILHVKFAWEQKKEIVALVREIHVDAIFTPISERKIIALHFAAGGRCLLPIITARIAEVNYE